MTPPSARLPLSARRAFPAWVGALTLAVVLLQGCAGGDPFLQGAERELQAGDYERVLELTEQALATDPANAQAHFYRAEAYRGLTHTAESEAQVERYASEAASSYSRVQELGAEEGRIQFGMITAYGEEMNHAARAFQQGAEDQQAYRRAAASFGIAAGIMPDSASAHLGQGIALLGAGETTDAAAPLRRAVDLDTDVPEAYLYLGRIYLAEDRADDAIAVLEQARQRFSDNDEIQSELLNTYARTGQTERAIAAYASAVEASPNDATLRYNYGSFLLQAERYEDAVEQLARATELDAASGSAHYNLGAAYINQAVVINEQMADLDPDSAEFAARRDQRDAFLRQAIGPLEEARTLLAAEGHDVQDVCQSLFRAYAQLRMNQEARAAAECAGIDLD